MKRREFISYLGILPIGVFKLKNNFSGFQEYPAKKPQTLLKQVEAICQRLAPHGWGELFLLHGLDIRAKNLAFELKKDIRKSINWKLRGFEDFSQNGCCAIEAGRPSESLLYHALASPLVSHLPNGKPLSAFPYIQDINVIENYIFASQETTLISLRAKYPDAKFGVAVFSSEYRNAPHTPHKAHADLCFSRIGVSRIGNDVAYYDAPSRSFSAINNSDPYTIRVIPARFAPYLAISVKGNRDSFGPMRFQTRDAHRDFWVPVHKLFSGNECLNGSTLNVTLESYHVNEKIKRFHLSLRHNKELTPWEDSDLEQFPFTINQDIAEFSDTFENILFPVPHTSLTEQAYYQNKKLVFRVPLARAATHQPHSGSTLYMPDGIGPELVYARQGFDHDKKEINLNEEPGIIDKVNEGGYDAVHYIDYSGEGYIKANVQGLQDNLDTIAAYSLVAAPTFLPLCNVRELAEWTAQQYPENKEKRIWYAKPYPLSDTRLPLNIKLKNSNFSINDITGSAIITMPGSSPYKDSPFDIKDASLRLSYLPDSSTGGFGPGWEVGIDDTTKPMHMALYRLSSPFTEDMKLCAAMSSFWPGTVPESANVMEALPKNTNGISIIQKNMNSIAPLTDLETGIFGGVSWDGIKTPRVGIIYENGIEYAQYTRTEYVDYVLNSTANVLQIARTGRITLQEYTQRIQALKKAYEAFHKICKDIPPDETKMMRMLSFSVVNNTVAEFQAALSEVNINTNDAYTFRFELFIPDSQLSDAPDFREVRVRIRVRAVMFILEDFIIYQNKDKSWKTLHG